MSSSLPPIVSAYFADEYGNRHHVADGREWPTVTTFCGITAVPTDWVADGYTQDCQDCRNGEYTVRLADETGNTDPDTHATLLAMGAIPAANRLVGRAHAEAIKIDEALDRPMPVTLTPREWNEVMWALNRIADDLPRNEREGVYALIASIHNQQEG